MKIYCDSWEEECKKYWYQCCCAGNGKYGNYSKYMFDLAIADHNRAFGEKQNGHFLVHCFCFNKNVYFVENSFEQIMKEAIKKYEEEANEKSSKEADRNNKNQV